MNDPVPMPSKKEREAHIRKILDQGLASARPRWRGLPLSALVFGVEDCLFLAVLLGLLPAALGFAPAGSLDHELPGILFLSAPLLYAAAHILTMWKESQCGTLDWKRSCRLSLQTLTALRMGLFGGAAVLVCVPVDVLLWRTCGGTLSLVRMLGISFASLFLHAALSLALRRLRWGAAIPVAAWMVLGGTFLCRPAWAWLLLEVPAAVFFLLAGVGLAYCLSRLRIMVNCPQKGGFIYAFR